VHRIEAAAENAETHESRESRVEGPEPECMAF
jgi:hypothetical protein